MSDRLAVRYCTPLVAAGDPPTVERAHIGEPGLSDQAADSVSPEETPVADLAIWSDGFHIDDAGNAISVHYADLRPSAARLPIATLVKSSRREHGIDVSGTIRIAPPVYHREHDEGPMHDPAEGKAARVSQERNAVDDPADLDEARIEDRELNRASELLGGTLRVTSTTTGVRRSSRTTESTIHGKNCWIFCTSIEPLGQSEIQAWQESMDPAYGYEAYIHRPSRVRPRTGFDGR